MITTILATLACSLFYVAGFLSGEKQPKPSSDPMARKIEEAVAKGWAFAGIIFRPGVALSEFDEDAEGSFCMTSIFTHATKEHDAETIKMNAAQILAADVLGDDAEPWE